MSVSSQPMAAKPVTAAVPPVPAAHPLARPPSTVHAPAAFTPHAEASPFAALLRLHDVSKELQKAYRDSALHSQQTIYDHTLRGIAKARSAQCHAFVLQMVGAAVQIGAGLVMLKMSTPSLKDVITRGKSASTALKTLGQGAPASAASAAATGTADTTGVIAAKITPKAVPSQWVHSRVMAVNALSQGLSGVFAQSGNYVARIGELAQQGEQAKATRESQMLELRNSQMQEQGAHAREIRDTIRTIIPNRSFHA